MKTFFVYFPFAVAFFTYLMYVLRCDVKVRGQAVWMIVLLSCASKFLIFQELGGDAFAPDLPEWIIWALNWLYSGLMILFALAVLTVFFNLPYKLFILPILAWSLSLVGVYNGTRPPVVEEITVESAKVPRELDGYRIAQISDMHISGAARRWRTRKVVEIANEINADLIVMTGDIVDGMPDQLAGDVEPMKDLKARDGVIYCTGNHEFYYPWLEWSRQYEEWGLKFLRGETLKVNDYLVIGGVDDPSVKVYEPLNIPTARGLFESCTNGEYRVLLQHRPVTNGTNNLLIDYCDLQLSGHTHGGVMPGLDKLIAHFNGGYVRGKYDIAEGTLYVCPGAGQWAGFPIRFFNPPTVSVITLKHR